MDINELIQSGIIEDYCLDLLQKEDRDRLEQLAAAHPELQAEIRAHQQVLAGYASSFASEPPASLKNRILATLQNLEKEEQYSAEMPPLLNRFSEKENWLRVVKPHLPEELEEDIFAKVLRNDSEVFQVILWVKTGYPDEVHHEVDESFMILEGECECYVEENVIRLGPGDYFQVPLDMHHDVRVTRGPVLAIVQRLKVA